MAQHAALLHKCKSSLSGCCSCWNRWVQGGFLHRHTSSSAACSSRERCSRALSSPSSCSSALACSADFEAASASAASTCTGQEQIAGQLCSRCMPSLTSMNVDQYACPVSEAVMTARRTCACRSASWAESSSAAACAEAAACSRRLSAASRSRSDLCNAAHQRCSLHHFTKQWHAKPVFQSHDPHL